MGIPTPVPPSDQQKSALVEQIIRGELTPEQAQQRYGLTRAELKDWVRIYRREARRAFDDRVKSVLSTQGIDMGDLSAAEFSGNIEDMSVAELLQTVQLGGKDAEIRIEQDRELSHIWCLGGQVVDATTGALRGASAVYRLLSFERGRVHADFSPVQRPRAITVSTQTLLMEGARRFDECRQLRAKLGDTTAVYVPSDRSLAPNVQATPEQFAVLRLFDGIRTMDEVVRVSTNADLETLEAIELLMDNGLLERVRTSRTSLRELPGSPVSVENSFVPFAASVGAQQLSRPRSRRWVWAVAAIGSATLGGALALRFADDERAKASAAGRLSSERSAAPAANGAPRATPQGPSSAAPRSAVPPSTGSLSTVPPGSLSASTPSPNAVSARVTPIAAFPTCPDGAVLLGEPARPATTSPYGLANGAQAAPPVAPFCMSKAEVTVAEYESCRKRGACDPVARDGEAPEARLSPELRQHAQQVYGAQCNAGQVGRERHPINCVTFRQASNYCAAVGGRLPTEVEWDLAARGTEGRRYPWGDSAPGPTRLNACGLECKGWYRDARLDAVFDGVMYDGDDGFSGTAPVASFPAGATSEGIYDLLGNVAEWTSTSVDFGVAEPAANVPETYVVRGGSFSSGVGAETAPALRLYLDADAHGRGVGFRCAFAPKLLP